MRKFKYIKSLFVIAICAITLTTSGIYTDKATAEPLTAVQAPLYTNETKPLSIVNSPKSYLNRTVTMKAKFDKFSTLGLDYKPAFKSSDDYISFLIKRDDTAFNIPLSEMKLFLKRDVAEKFIDLKTNDEISITGVVFSDALGDAWIDVKELSIIKKAPDETPANGSKNGVN